MALSLQSLGKGLYTKTTLELGIEKSIADSQAKLAVLSSLNKAEVEVRESKRFGIKRKRVEVKNYEDFIESLDSYAKLSNQPLTVEQVYFALKDLEKGADGDLKVKIKALRKEVGKREGISSRRIVYASALGILGLAAFATWYLSQDHKAPEIKKVDYKDRVNKGEEQEVSVKVFEDNPGEAFLKFNSSSIQIPLVNKFDNGTAFYKTSFDPASVLAREGLFNAELVVKDKAGNEARQRLSFLANLQAPVLKDLSIEKVDLGKYKISLAIEEDNLKEAYTLVGSRRIPLNKHGDKLFGQVDLGCDKEFEVKAEDVFGLKTSLPASAVLSEADKLELSLYCSSNLFREIYSKDKALANSILYLAKNNGSAIPKNIAYQVLDQIERDGRAKDKVGVARNAFNILNEADVKNLINKGSICVAGNYSQALIQKLPKHDIEDIKRLIQASEACSDIVDFSSIVFKSVDNNNAYLIPEPARETWLTVEILKRIKESGFEIEKHPEMFLGLNGKVISNAWCFFNDSPYYSIAAREKEVNNRIIKITDEEVLNAMMLQWNLYSKFAPQLNGSEKLYNRDFPWYNSTQLKALYPDKNELRVALFKLFYLPETTYSMKEGKRVFGIKAAETSLREAMEEYETIARLYPNGKIGMYNEDPRFFYKGELSDRFCNGLEYTVGEYVGFNNETIQYFKDKLLRYLQGDQWAWNELEFHNKIDQSYGLDQFLTKNWKYWDLVKFIIGYERWNRAATETEDIPYIMPAVLRMFGFPADNMIIHPTPLGASGGEWSICLPPYMAEKIKVQFPNSTILFGPGYDFSLYSCADGLIRERGIDNTLQHNPIDNGILKVWQWLGDKRVYLMKRD